MAMHGVRPPAMRVRPHPAASGRRGVRAARGGDPMTDLATTVGELVLCGLGLYAFLAVFWLGDQWEQRQRMERWQRGDIPRRRRKWWWRGRYGWYLRRPYRCGLGLGAELRGQSACVPSTRSPVQVRSPACGATEAYRCVVERWGVDSPATRSRHPTVARERAAVGFPVCEGEGCPWTAWFCVHHVPVCS